MNKKITVIVPIYNAEKNIEKCVNSILNQTYSNLEVILINDGSKDKTEEICKNLAKKDNRIKYFYKENSGVSATRNLGLDKVTGDFISFIDSDDYIENDMYEIMLNKIDDSEIVICDYCEVNNDNEFKTDTEIEMKEKVFDNLDDLILNIDNKKINRYVNPPWNKLIKTDIVKKQNIRFDSRISLGEDLLFNLQCMKVAKKLQIVDKKLYNYSINTEGLGLKKRDVNEYVNNSIKLINELINLSNDTNKIGNILLNELCNMINRLINEYEIKYIFKLLRSLQYEKIKKITYKDLTKKNYLIHILLKRKKYRMIVFLYIIKNKIKNNI